MLSQTPGRTPAEKAGPRQELVAVVKEDTSDLPENAVLLWCARRLVRMARAYCLRNAIWRHGERFMRVQALRRLLDRILKHPNLQAVGALHHHMTTPTYCFQFEKRYRHIWDAYVRIRRQDHAIDDVWRWQGHLWGTTARLILGSLFLDAREWDERHASTVYFHAEGPCGDWTTGPSSPGPFDSSLGPCFILDLRRKVSREQADALQVPAQVLATGADWVLCWPRSKALCPVWTVLDGISAGRTPRELPDLKALRHKMKELRASTGWNWQGWILHALPEHDPQSVEWILGRKPIYVLQLPAGLHTHWGDLSAGLDLTLEELDDR